MGAEEGIGCGHCHHVSNPEVKAICLERLAKVVKGSRCVVQGIGVHFMEVLVGHGAVDFFDEVGDEAVAFLICRLEEGLHGFV